MKVKISQSRTGKEIEQLEAILAVQNRDELRGYNPHKAIVDGQEVLALDARELNKELRQTGRGDYRYLMLEGRFYSIAIHRPQRGDYRTLRHKLVA